MAFLKKLAALFKKAFSPPKRRRKSPVRKAKKRTTPKSPLKRRLKVKTFSAQRSRTSPRKLKRFAPPQRSKASSLEITQGLLIGEITHFFPRIQVCVLSVSAGSIKVGDQILISGKERRFTQKVASLQIESVNVQTARRGDLVGLKLDKPAQVGNKIFKVTP